MSICWQHLGCHPSLIIVICIFNLQVLAFCCYWWFTAGQAEPLQVCGNLNDEALQWTATAPAAEVTAAEEEVAAVAAAAAEAEAVSLHIQAPATPDTQFCCVRCLLLAVAEYAQICGHCMRYTITAWQA
jgi:hypothetical protein